VAELPAGPVPYSGPVIDAHHHLWDLALGAHPWIEGRDPAMASMGNLDFLRRNYLPADFLADVGATNFAGSVHVEAAWDRARDPVEETRWLMSINRPRNVAARLVGYVPLEAPEVAEMLAAHREAGPVVGVRETIRWHPDPARRWTEAGILDRADKRRGIAALNRAGLLLEVLMNPYQSDDVARLARDMPDLQIVVNHCATPVDRDEAGLERWRNGLALMAAEPNVAIKVSNFGAYAPDKSPGGLRAAVLTCVHAFGPDRSMFGTDYPVGRRALSYAENVAGFTHAIAGFSAADQRALFHDTAHRIYRFGEALG
jgi:predicted TIM-barrel fold metal-dependent hydrolase